MLSADGDHPMTRLSDTQLVILSTAAQRADLSVLPLPDSLTLKGGALNKVMDSLRNRGLIRMLGGDGGPERVVITSEGMAAIGVESEDDASENASATQADTVQRRPMPVVRRRPRPATKADGAATPAKKGSRQRQGHCEVPKPRRPTSPRRAPAPSRR